MATLATYFRKDDTVVLTGLSRAEMNGKTATVISVDHAEGKALVKVEVMDPCPMKMSIFSASGSTIRGF